MACKVLSSFNPSNSMSSSLPRTPALCRPSLEYTKVIQWCGHPDVVL